MSTAPVAATKASKPGRNTKEFSATSAKWDMSGTRCLAHQKLRRCETTTLPRPRSVGIRAGLSSTRRRAAAAGPNRWISA